MSDEEEDYMTMAFGDDAAAAASHRTESSLQRRIRLQREGRERGRVPSKAELARAADAEREAALSRSLLVPRVPAQGGRPGAKTGAGAGAPMNKGLAMMARMGFRPGQALGPASEQGSKSEKGGQGVQTDGDDVPTAVTEPIRIQIKRGRGGIGAEPDKAADEPDGKRAKTTDGHGEGDLLAVDPLAYRDRIRQERATQRLERQLHAAQVVAEGMAADREEPLLGHSLPRLADVNVRWRGLVRDRRVAEQARNERQRQQQQLDARLRGIEADEDADDRMALGKTRSLAEAGLRRTVQEEGDSDSDSEAAGGDDNDDAELAAFEALPVEERLQQVVDWLRAQRRYCFWCKHTYEDADMDGCPGAMEADHD